MDLNKEIFPDNDQRSFWIVYAVATLAMLCKLFVSYHVYGTNDVTSWFSFAKYIQEYGTFNIYPHFPFYNHPPFISWLLKFMPTQNEAGFPFQFRILPICADYGSIFVIWRLLTLHKAPNKLLICLICSLSPINLFISGYHGNTDSIFVFLILLTIYFLEVKNIIVGGFCYALSMCIKIVPLIIAPFILFHLRSKKERAALVLILLTVFSIVYLPYLIFDYRSLIKNIFQYGGIKAIWGIGHLMRFVIFNPHYLFQLRQTLANIFVVHVLYFVLPFAVLIVFLAWYLSARRTINLVESCFLVFSLFLAFTPGFGIQYLSWLSFFAVMVNPLLGAGYVLIGGMFIARVYTFWGGGVPPYFADSVKHGLWGGYENILELALWVLVVVMLCKFLYDKKILPVRLKRFNFRAWLCTLPTFNLTKQKQQSSI